MSDQEQPVLVIHEPAPQPEASQVDTFALVCEMLQQRRTGAKGFITEHPATAAMIALVQSLSATVDKTVPILITGPSGTGKELVARMWAPDQFSPFIAVNCAALPDTLYTSLLFGHRKGTFTGADSDRQGAFVAAGNGAILLDEIGDMPLNQQAALLRVIQERNVVRLGETSATPIQCRIIAATNRDLEDAVAAGTFREDLYARLDMLRFTIPPLLDRPEDLRRIGLELGLNHDDITQILTTPAFKAKLVKQNVRALQAFATRKRYLGYIS